MKKHALIIIFFITILGSITVSIITIINNPKIAYVNTNIILDKYIGLIEVRNILQQKTTTYNKEIDSLQKSYTIIYNQLVNNHNKNNDENNKLLEKELTYRRNEIIRLQEDKENSINKENEIMIQGALNQINSFIHQYAEKKGIDIVLGGNQSGNILYGNDKYDITNEVLEGLNNSYKQQ